MGVLALAVLLNAAADVLLREGMARVGEVSVRRPWTAARAVLRHWQVPLGVAAMAGFFGLYTLALTGVDVSLANPVTALHMVLATAWAASRMGERVTPRRWAGVVLVTAGAVLAGFS